VSDDRATWLIAGERLTAAVDSDRGDHRWSSRPGVLNARGVLQLSAPRSPTAPMKRAPTYRTPLCPVAAAHGHLLDWPSAFAAWFCPSSAHDITPFFNSDLEPVRASRAADTRALLGSSTGRKSP
jgi:hypothetical protein